MGDGEVVGIEFLDTIEVDAEEQRVLRLYKVWQWEPMTGDEKAWYAENG